MSVDKKVGKYYVVIQNVMHFGNFRAYIGISVTNSTGATSGAGTANPSGAPEFTPVFSVFLLLHL
jgi:hypothetical protein